MGKLSKAKLKLNQGKKSCRFGIREKRLLSLIFSYLTAATAVVGLAALTAVFPKWPIVFDVILKELNRNKDRKISSSELRKMFEKMKRERLVNIIDEGAEIKIILRKEGVKTILINNLAKVKFERPRVWDKSWRVVIFDIPEKYKRERDAFVLKLKELNFYSLQKSVFVYPYPLVEIVDFLSEVFGISSYIRVIDATTIEGEEEIQAHFGVFK